MRPHDSGNQFRAELHSYGDDDGACRMSRGRTSLLRRAGSEQGAAIIIVAFSCLLLLGISAFAIDVGYMLQAHRDLQATADAAALAGAQLLPDTAAAISTARAYSAISGGKNFRSAYPNVTMVTGYPQTKCLTSTGVSCGTTNANAIVVKEQETLSALFAGMLGFPTITITATSTTSMSGGVPHPLDVIVVLDTTGSMGGSCSASVPGKSSHTRLDCAKAG